MILCSASVLPFAVAAAAAQAAPNRVGGSVTSEDGRPVRGAAVQVKGTGIGTTTDAHGVFVLPAIKLPATLVVSFVGFETREVRVEENVILNIKLHRSTITTQKAVVTGYETISAPRFTGSARRVTADSLIKGSGLSLEQSLQGKITGALITSPSGMVGTRQKVRVRGTSTLMGNQEPVWVVDGIIQEDPLPFKAQDINNFNADSFDMMREFVGSAVAWLNPNDIEDITVLKDAAATVLYGVKAANGVIVIQTKRGQEGRTQVNYSGGLTVSPRLNYNKMNLMNSWERAAVSREIAERGLLGPMDFNAVQEHPDADTDWFKLLFQNSLSHNHSLSISGGTQSVQYYSSIGASQTRGTARGNNQNQFTGNISLTAKFNSRLSVTTGLGAATGKTHAFYQVDPYKYAMTTNRALLADQFFNKDGFLYNVRNELDNTGNWNQNRSMNFHVSAQYKIIEGLELESLFGYTQGNIHARSWASERSHYITSKFRWYEYGAYGPADAQYRESNLPHGGELNTIDSRTSAWNWRNSLSFNRTFNDTHRLNIMLGEELRSTTADDWRTRVYGYFPESGGRISLPSPTVTYGSGEYAYTAPNLIYDQMPHTLVGIKNNFVSAYASANYSFDERYILSASARTDASNRFGQNKRNRFLPVWSAGARWNVSNEPWMREKAHWLSELNLRASYGWQGNVLETVSPDLILSIPDDIINYHTGERMLTIKNLPYPDLRWEKVHSLNLGVDLGLWRNRLMASVEYYHKKTVDMVANEPLPREYGMETMPINAGTMLNRGIELTLNGTIVRTPGVTWQMSVNGAKNFNRIRTSLDRSDLWQAAVSGALAKEGYPVSGFWAFDYTGADPASGMPTFNLPAGSVDATHYMKYMGKLDPDFQGGFQTSLRWKQLVISTAFNFQIGGKRFLDRMFQRDGGMPLPYENMPRDFADRWTPSNTSARIPGLAGMIDDGERPAWPTIALPNGHTGFPYEMYNFSTDRVVSASFLRCSSIALGWALPEHWVRRAGMRSVSLRASVTNPFVAASKRLHGMDPEVAVGNQPIARTFNMGINVSF